MYNNEPRSRAKDAMQTNRFNWYLNPLVPGRCDCDLKWVISYLISRVDILSFCCVTVLKWIPQDPIGSVNGLIPSGNKPLIEPVLSNISDAIRYL